jgi:hypothetical protein
MFVMRANMGAFDVEGIGRAPQLQRCRGSGGAPKPARGATTIPWDARPSRCFLRAGPLAGAGIALPIEGRHAILVRVRRDDAKIISVRCGYCNPASVAPAAA